MPFGLAVVAVKYDQVSGSEPATPTVSPSRVNTTSTAVTSYTAEPLAV